MATKKVKTENTKLDRKAIKDGIKKTHDTIINTSEDLLNSTFKTGEKWQKLMANAVKKSEPMREKQIDMVFDAAEAVKDQVEHGANRFKVLVGLEGDVMDKMKDRVTNNPLLKRFRSEVDEFVDEVSDSPIVKKAEKVATKIKVEVSDAIEEAKDKIEDVIEDVEDKIEDVIEDVKGATTKNDLKVIDGVGPKLESILNEAGITSYIALAKTSEKKLTKILEEAGPRYRMHNPSDWKAQAKLAAAGKLEELTAWIKDKKSKA